MTQTQPMQLIEEPKNLTLSIRHNNNILNINIIKTNYRGRNFV